MYLNTNTNTFKSISNTNTFIICSCMICYIWLNILVQHMSLFTHFHTYYHKTSYLGHIYHKNYHDEVSLHLRNTSLVSGLGFPQKKTLFSHFLWKKPKFSEKKL